MNTPEQTADASRVMLHLLCCTMFLAFLPLSNTLSATPLRSHRYERSIDRPSTAHQDRILQSEPAPGRNRAARMRSAALDIRHIRLQLAIDPDQHRVRGKLFIYARRLNSSIERLILPSFGVRLTKASMTFSSGGKPVDLAIVDSTAYSELVTTADSASALSLLDGVDSTSNSIFGPAAGMAEELSIYIEFDIEHGLTSFPLGKLSGPWSAIRSTALLGGRNWLPIPDDTDRSFSTELRVIAPAEWNVVLPGSPDPIRVTSERNTWIFYSDSTVSELPSRLAAFSGAEESIRSVSASSDSVFYVGLARAHGYFDRLNGVNGSEPSYITWIYEDRVRTLAPGLYIIPDPRHIDPDAVDQNMDVPAARVMAEDWVRRNFELAPQGDRWMADSFASYLVADYLRETYGQGAFADYMWGFRDEYYRSSLAMRCPLAWLDPLDYSEGCAHNDARGLWILRMLAERIGRDHLISGIQQLADLAASQPVSTDIFRQLLEDVSGDSLAPFFEAWIYGSGYPIIDFSYSTRPSQEAIDVSIKQSPDDPTSATIFEFDAQVQIFSLSGVDSSLVPVRKQQEQFVVPVSLRPQYVLFDPAARLLYQPRTPPSTEVLIAGLRRASTEAGRISMINQLDQRTIEPAHLLGLRSILSRPLSDQVRGRIVRILGQAAPSVAALKEIINGSESDVPLIRASAIEAFAHFGGSAEARSRVLAAANTSRNPIILAAAVASLIRLDSTLTEAVLQSAMVTESQNDFVRRRAVYALAKSSMTLEGKWSLIKPLFRAGVNTATRVAAFEISEPFFSDVEFRLILLKRWPRSSVHERGMLISYYTSQVDEADLSSTEIGELDNWLISEPVDRISGQLHDYQTRWKDAN